MEIKVIIAAHKQYLMPDKDCYFPVQVGRALHQDIGYTPDIGHGKICRQML